MSKFTPLTSLQVVFLTLEMFFAAFAPLSGVVDETSAAAPLARCCSRQPDCATTSLAQAVVVTTPRGPDCRCFATVASKAQPAASSRPPSSFQHFGPLATKSLPNVKIHTSDVAPGVFLTLEMFFAAFAPLSGVVHETSAAAPLTRCCSRQSGCATTSLAQAVVDTTPRGPDRRSFATMTSRAQPAASLRPPHSFQHFGPFAAKTLPNVKIHTSDVASVFFDIGDVFCGIMRP
jgi:hypothetical protein